MNVLDFLRAGESAAPAPVVLFCPGKSPRARAATFEPFLADQAAQRIIDATVDPASRDLAFTAFYADETQPGEIVLEAETLPFLVEQRVVFVRGAERYASESAAGALLHYLENPSESTVLLFITNRVDKRTKFYKACAKAGEVIECPELNEREVTTWLHQAIEKHGKTAEDSAIREIVQRAGTRLSDVNNALTVVVGYIGDAESHILERHVIEACADVAEEEIWALTDAIAASQTGRTLRALRRLSDLGKHPDEILGTINWLLKMAYLLAIGDPNQSVSNFVGQKIRPLADKLGVAKVRVAFALCTEAQFKMRNTGVDSALTLELLVLKLAAPRRKIA